MVRAVDVGTWRSLRREGGAPEADRGGEEAVDHATGVEGGGGGRDLVCVACGEPITSDRARVDVGGQHRHVCVNPSGIPFDIECFRRAPGCVPHGPRETYWSWFEGYAWQIALCRGCRAHLGWSFHGDGGGFHGLITARIVERDRDSPG